MPQNKEDEHPFDYSRGSGKGPEHWGRINPEWKICNAGLMQSPVDLLDKRVEIMPELGRLRRNYKPALATLTNRGHDIMLKWKQEAGTITVDGVKFHLTQCHWHSPSEHSFNGSRYQLELHMVHESRRGDIAVVGSIYKYGKPDPFLSKLIPHIRDLEEDEKDVVYEMEEMGSCPRKVERDEGGKEDEEISTPFLQTPKQSLLRNDEEENEGE
ncbi:hypothetical protein MRB53_008045 [Persea americana]|uniref:Uncharacterized protein n=1 Tax=Persea americana TaxID=3435 RepID=A0ACC2MKN8_PERAE|nr:hypothetical protein MRB53_008045 [Persea americana]